MAAPRLRKSYLVEASHGEVYTGGPVAYHPGFRSLITPQEGRINTLPLHNSSVYVFPISGVREESEEDLKVTVLVRLLKNSKNSIPGP